MSKNQTKKTYINPPEPLRGDEKDSFAEHTLSNRLPDIARQVLDNNPWQEDIQENLQELIAEMPHRRLTLLEDGFAPDNDAWEQYLAPYLDMTWLQAPWFLAEMYFFRRILKATKYFQPGFDVDPYKVQKQAELPSALEAIQQICDQLRKSLFRSQSLNPVTMEQLIHLNIWGNQSDLSIWSSAQGNQPDRPHEDQRTDFLLNDHTQAAARYLLDLNKRDVRVDFILDNVGLELAYDLVLTDTLLTTNIVNTVIFNLKPYPTYVSDATPKDVLESIAFYKREGAQAVQQMAERLERNISDKRLILVSDYYWGSPLMGWEMPSRLVQGFSQADLIISKGDANYRRWLGDRKWEPETPLKDGLGYLPAPMLLLRVLKAELVVGLDEGVSVKMDELDPTWMYNGRWGVIQFIQ
jgi:uncharacterized protein with ATP-grasp and redox domains